MKIKISILLTVILFFFILSCSNGNLSKSEAKKQIEEMRRKDMHSTSIELGSGMYLGDGRGDEPQNRTNLANKGQQYVRFEIQDRSFLSYSYLIKNFEILDKAKPYVTTDKDNHAYVNAGTYELAITSITEPAPDITGGIVCKAYYKDSVSLNELGKDIDFRYRGGDKIAKFEKMQDGWKLKDVDVKE